MQRGPNGASGSIKDAPAANEAKEGNDDLCGLGRRLHRIDQRLRQISFGKSTPGYANYIRCVPVHTRSPSDPTTPRVTSDASKRKFDSILKNWRRSLHAWDDRAADDGDDTGRRGVAFAAGENNRVYTHDPYGWVPSSVAPADGVQSHNIDPFSQRNPADE